MTTKNFKTLHTWDTIYSADSVEWCPVSPYKNYFVCGTYHLPEDGNSNSETKEKKEYQRTGAITLFSVFKEKLEVKDVIQCPAILDLKWCSVKLNGNTTLASANAAGEVCLFYLENGLLKPVSKCILKKEIGDFLSLSLDWIKSDSPDLICSSDSKGNITLLKVLNDTLTVVKNWNAHSLEAWIVCFDSFNSNIIYSGGDEAQLKVWDTRCENSPKITSTKHTAGVTALNSNVYKDHNLVSGSYDETVLFWDTRNWKKPIESVPASGGLWRLKWEPQSRARYLLAACVYGGFQIFDSDSFSVVGEFKEHESLAYGADWCFLNNKETDELLSCGESTLIVTCSFYDHKICVSLWDENYMQ